MQALTDDSSMFLQERDAYLEPISLVLKLHINWRNSHFTSYTLRDFQGL